MVICSIVVYFIAVLLFALVLYVIGIIGDLPRFWRIIIYLFGGSTLLGILFAPLQYGGILTVSASEAIKPSKAGTRYKVFSLIIIIIYALEFVLSIIMRKPNWAALYVIAFGVSLLISGAAMMKDKEERISKLRAGKNYTKDDIIDALSKGLITPEDAKKKLDEL